MASDVCNTCGLPNEMCVCEDVEKNSSTITVEKDDRQFGKVMTLVKGISDTEINIDEIETTLKKEFACGGTVKNGMIQLQGDHKDEVTEFLEEEEGFNVEKSS